MHVRKFETFLIPLLIPLYTGGTVLLHVLTIATTLHNTIAQHIPDFAPGPQHVIGDSQEPDQHGSRKHRHTVSAGAYSTPHAYSFALSAKDACIL